MSNPRWDELPLPSEWEKPSDPERFERERLSLLEKPPGGIKVGTSLDTQLPVYITPDMLATHMQVLGGTGVGKSYFLEGIIKSLIMQGQGVCLIDPHGDLYHRILEFCAHLDDMQPERQLSHRVIPFDVANTEHIIGFNPIARNARVMTYQVVSLMESIRKAWGQASFYETPRLARWLFNAAYAVIDANLTFLQIQHLVDPMPNAERGAIIQQIRNPRIRAEWEWLASIRERERSELTESVLNRIKPFVENDVIRYIIGQHTNTLDFTEVMAERKIVLVNLAKQNTISEDDQHLLGTLLVNEMLSAAFARASGKRQPYFLFIDEFAHFVTKDICEILDGGRKFGLHLILAHQHLHQLKEKDPEVYYSTLANARLKAVFGGLIDEDLEVLGKEFYTGELDPDQVKDEIWQTKYHPVETSRTISTHSTSESFGESQSTGDSYGTSDSYGDTESIGEVTHRSLTAGEVYIPDSGFWSTNGLQSTSENTAEGSSTSLSRGRSSSHARSSSVSRSESRNASRTAGESIAVVPFYEYHEYQELSSRTFRALEEQLYIKKSQMKRQSTQHAAILIPETPVQLVKAPTIKEHPVSGQIHARFMQACIEQSGCFKTKNAAVREIEVMEATLSPTTAPPTPIEADMKAKGAGAKKRTKKDKPNIFKTAQNDLIESE